MKIFLSVLIVFSLLTITTNSPSYSANSDNNIKNKKVNAVRFSPDNKLLATAGTNNKVIIWNVALNKSIETLIGHKGNITEISFTPDGKKLLSASEDKMVKIWDIKSGKEILNINASNYGIYSLAISPDGKEFASGSLKELKIWNLSNGKQIGKNTVNQYVSSLVFSKDGKYLAAGSYGTINFFRTKDLKKYYEIKNAHNGYISSMCFNPKNKLLVTGSMDNSVKFWDWTISSKNKLSNVFNYHNAPVTSTAFSLNGNLLASGSWDKTVKIFDIYNNKILFTIKLLSSINDISFSSDEKFLAIGNSNGVITFKDIKAKKITSKPNTR